MTQREVLREGKNIKILKTVIIVSEKLGSFFPNDLCVVVEWKNDWINVRWEWIWMLIVKGQIFYPKATLVDQSLKIMVLYQNP